MGNSKSRDLERRIEEHRQIVSNLQGQVSTLSGERDTLRAKGEVLSKKLATQESTISELRAQVYTLTSERDTLRIEQNRKDEIISRVTTEGEEFSKKLAAQESTITKLRSQIKEFEEQKKELITKLEVEEKKLKIIKRDKSATEKLPQETLEKSHAEFFALMSEGDRLRMEKNKKDEIISRIMAEGEELSKKLAAQESTISKLHAQV